MYTSKHTIEYKQPISVTSIHCLLQTNWMGVSQTFILSHLHLSWHHNIILTFYVASSSSLPILSVSELCCKCISTNWSPPKHTCHSINGTKRTPAHPRVTAIWPGYGEYVVRDWIKVNTSWETGFLCSLCCGDANGSMQNYEWYLVMLWCSPYFASYYTFVASSGSNLNCNSHNHREKKTWAALNRLGFYCLITNNP